MMNKTDMVWRCPKCGRTWPWDTPSICAIWRRHLAKCPNAADCITATQTTPKMTRNTLPIGSVLQ